jgi:tetratricopeptide (TPR) repeat protein
MSLGATYYGIENYEKALESFDIVLSDDPDDTDARILKASALVLIATTSPEYMDDKEYKTANAVEAKKLVTFNDVVLNNRQKTFLDKLKVYIDKLLGRD